MAMRYCAIIRSYKTRIEICFQYFNNASKYKVSQKGLNLFACGDHLKFILNQNTASMGFIDNQFLTQFQEMKTYIPCHFDVLLSCTMFGLLDDI